MTTHLGRIVADPSVGGGDTTHSEIAYCGSPDLRVTDELDDVTCVPCLMAAWREAQNRAAVIAGRVDAIGSSI